MNSIVKEFSPDVRRSVILTLILAILTVVTISDSLWAFDRKVLFEDFTSTTCPPCAGSAPALEAALEQLGDEVVSPIAWHMSWPAPGNDPWYLDNPDENNARRTLYGVNSIPTFFIDGEIYTGNRTQAAFANAIQVRTFEPAPVAIDLRGSIANEVLTVNVEITAEQDLDVVTLFIALTEDHVRYNAPTGQRDHHDAMVKMIPNDRGTTFDIAGDQSLDFEFEQDMEGLGWHELEIDNLILVAWVQDRDQEVHQSQNISLDFVTPFIDVSGWEVNDDADGDGDGRAEAGETVDLILTFENAQNYLPAEEGLVILSTDDEGISITQDSYVLPGLENGASVSNTNSPFQFRVEEGFEAHPVVFTANISAQPGDFEGSSEISFMIEWPPFFIVDGSANRNAGFFIQDLFGFGELPYADRWDRVDNGILTGENINNYRITLFHSFNNQEEALTEFEAEILTSYLASGGHMIFSSIGAITGMTENPLFSDFLGVELDSSDVNTNWIRGYQGDPDFENTHLFLGGSENECAGWPAFTPSLTPLEGATPVLYYDSNGEDNGVAGVKYETDNYKALVFGFPIECIGGVANTDELWEFTERCWSWISIPAEIKPGTHVRLDEFALNAAYPNPFNASAVVPFSLDRAGNIQLGLYSLAGRRIVDLFNGHLPAGQQKVTLNADMMNISSGIYIIKLNTGNQSATRKVLYLR